MFKKCKLSIEHDGIVSGDWGRLLKPVLIRSHLTWSISDVRNELGVVRRLKNRLLDRCDLASIKANFTRKPHRPVHLSNFANLSRRECLVAITPRGVCVGRGDTIFSAHVPSRFPSSSLSLLFPPSFHHNEPGRLSSLEISDIYVCALCIYLQDLNFNESGRHQSDLKTDKFWIPHRSGLHNTFIGRETSYWNERIFFHHP